MTTKFTEDQYAKIINIFDEVNDEYNMGFLNPNIVTMFQDRLYKEFGDVLYFVEDWQAITALANPLTRDLVKGNLVETEEKFLFTKIKEVEGEILSLNQIDGDTSIYLDSDDPTPLTIKQAEEYGYNLDAFTKTPYEHGVFTVHVSEEDDLPF